jgi:hypothetical protein
MKADGYLWGAVAALLCTAGSYVLLDSVRHASQYAEEYVLLGAVLTVLGLATLWILFEQYRQGRAMARHLQRGSHLSSPSSGHGRADHS